MYESPIELITNDIVSSVAKQMDYNIYRAVLTTGVNVDKEELIKALKYDRDQYNKGFEDGAKEFAEKLISEKSYPHPNELNTRIVYVSDILEILGEKI